MSLFGESKVDQRDYGFAFGAFKGSAFLGLVMATKGLLSPLDARSFRQQMMDGIDIVPADQLSADGREAIETALNDIELAATTNFRAAR